MRRICEIGDLGPGFAVERAHRRGGQVELPSNEDCGIGVRDRTVAEPELHPLRLTAEQLVIDGFLEREVFGRAG